ncbi:hypothetical protein NDU88_001107 [Pleurodeles waltl]|uniref:Uncharacterized protein n=1 Tax=Pleurodeles waltl TaxID=8319 RepID=A0AAV7Q2P0_PLEWA|nr:hypothetical protein NDU88_001107 [Pleurodeles waltl]
MNGSRDGRQEEFIYSTTEEKTPIHGRTAAYLLTRHTFGPTGVLFDGQLRMPFELFMSQTDDDIEEITKYCLDCLLFLRRI